MNTQNLEKRIKIGLSIALLLCLFDMPYGFYQLVRFIALIGFSILAYNSNEDKTAQIVFIICALMFQPLFKISFGRTIWNIIDVVVAIGLIISLFSKPSKNE